MIAPIFAGICAEAYQVLLANALAGSAAPDVHMVAEYEAEDHATPWRVWGRYGPALGEKSKNRRNFKGFEHATSWRVFKKKISYSSMACKF